MNRLFIGSIGVCVMLAVSGCGTSEVKVKGAVQLDGAPVEEGRILFREVDGEKNAFSGAITNGKYEVNCKPGKMRVEIIASRPIPGKFDKSNGTPEQVGEMYIPVKYNSQSTLTADITGSSREHSFDLKTK